MAIAKNRIARISDFSPLPQEFFFQETEALACALLGKRLVRLYRNQRLSGIIVETEAYLGAKDPAAHTWKGRLTKRNRSMFLPGGHAYVYFVYGMHYCFNVVAKREGEPEGVLIRALAPDPGLIAPTNGPAKLCKALHLTRAQDGLPLFSGSAETIFIEESGMAPIKKEVVARPRIGVDYAGEAALWPLRFYWAGNAHISKK